MNLLIYFLSGILLLLLFRIADRVLKALGSKRNVGKTIVSFWPLLEWGVWVAFAFWGGHVLFSGYVHYDLIMGTMAVLLVIGLAWYVFRDHLAGAILKSEKVLKTGQSIKTPFAQGRIQHMGRRSVDVVDAEGEVVRIPYTRLSNAQFTILSEEDKTHEMRIKIPGSSSPEAVRSKVMSQLLCLPWVALPAPEVGVLRDGKDDVDYHLVVRFHTYMKSQVPLVEKKISDLVEERV